jgi:hypothetical protein
MAPRPGIHHQQLQSLWVLPSLVYGVGWWQIFACLRVLAILGSPFPLLP